MKLEKALVDTVAGIARDMELNFYVASLGDKYNVSNRGELCDMYWHSINLLVANSNCRDRDKEQFTEFLTCLFDAYRYSSLPIDVLYQWIEAAGIALVGIGKDEYENEDENEDEDI